MMPATQEQINNYVEVAKHFPLVEGQLEAMVILHFDIPDEEARTMIEKAKGVNNGQVD